MNASLQPGQSSTDVENPARKLHWYSLRWQVAVIEIVLAIGCSGVWYARVGRYSHAIGAGPAGPAVAAAAFGRPWSTGQFVLVGLGDSITNGYGSSHAHDYFDLLAANDDAAYPEMKGRDLRHALPGLSPTPCDLAADYTVSQEHLNFEVPRIKTYPPEVHGLVAITTGGNDLIHNYGASPPADCAMYGCTEAQATVWKESFRQHLTAIIKRVTAKFPGGCDIFLANIYDPTDGVGDIDHALPGLPAWPDGLKALALLNGVIADAAQANPNVHLVDLHAGFLGHGIHCADSGNPNYDRADPHYWYYRNLEDPNDRGYDAIRRMFLIELNRVLGGRS
jgi:lysophospholipase L1-like esterase